ncbi:MAG: DegT/DnrJ/EryC1/StrS family aminotransferase [Candidatus Kapaibacteriales bacterium]
MQFIDLQRQFNVLESLINEKIKQVLSHCKFILGPEVFELEQKLAEYVNRRFCVSCSSGTDALLMPLMALGIGPGDAVFTTPFTFIATSEVIRLVGATPVFVDIESHTFNIDPNQLEVVIQAVERSGKLRPKAIIPVDLFGLPADYPAILEIAKRHNLVVIEDSAQSFGGKINGQKTCSFGEVSATSFFPAKPLGAYGDGGAIFTDDEHLYNLLISIRVHGQGVDRYENIRNGINGRLDTIQAAILLAKLTILDDELVKRNNIANKYNSLLKNKVIVPKIPDGYTSAWAQYSILTENEKHRQGIIDKLKHKGIPTAIYYPKPLHLQKVNEDLGYKEGDFPISEEISRRILSLPMHPYLKDEEIEEIVSVFLELEY